MAKFKINPSVRKIIAEKLHDITCAQDDVVHEQLANWLRPNISAFFANSEYRFSTLHIEISCTAGEVSLGIYPKFSRDEKWYIAPCRYGFRTTEVAKRLVIHPEVRKIRDAAELRLDEDTLQQQFIQTLFSHAHEINGVFREFAQHPHERMQQVLPEENMPYELSVAPSDFIKPFKNVQGPALWESLASKYNQYDGFKHRYVRWSSIKYSVVEENTIKIRYCVVLDGNYFAPISHEDEIAYQFPLTRLTKQVATDFERFISDKVSGVLESLWEAETPERYDIGACRSKKATDELSAGITKIMREYLDSYIKSVDSQFATVRVRWEDSKTCITKTANGYRIFFSDEVSEPLGPQSASLLDQRIVDNYTLENDPEHTPPPKHEGQWVRFAVYLAEMYKQRLTQEDLLSYPLPIKIEVQGINAKVKFGGLMLCFDCGKNRYADDEEPADNAFEFARKIVDEAVSRLKRIYLLDLESRVTAAEAALLMYIQKHPHITATDLKQAVKLPDILSSRVPDMIRELSFSDVVETREVRNYYGEYTQMSICPMYKSTDFFAHTRPYDLRDLEYVKSDLRLSIIKKATKNMQNETLPQTISAWSCLSKKDMTELCKDAKVQEKFLSLPPEDADFVRSSLTQMLGDRKQVQKIFLERDIAHLKALAADSTEEGAEAISDFIMETDSQVINAFFKSEIGKQYLANCKREQLEPISDALLCVSGCKLLYNRVNKQLEKMAKTT